jgi:hypothetical protein
MDGAVMLVAGRDHRFPRPEEAATVLGGFFGDAIRERILRERWSRVREWTGIWVTDRRR